MTKEEIREAVQEIFRDLFDDDKLIITNETDAEDIADWDSLMQIRLTVAIEKEFKIKFDFEELKELRNVGDMLELVEKKAVD